MGEQNQAGDGEPQITEEEVSKQSGVIPEGLKLDDPSTFTPERVSALAKTAQTVAAQKTHWRGKAIDPETKKPFRDLYAEAQTRVITPPANNAPVEALQKDVEGLKSLEEKRAFGHSHELSPEAVDQVFAAAKGLGITPLEALEKPLIKAGIAESKRQSRVTGNVPGPSGRVGKVETKSFLALDENKRREAFNNRGN